MKIKKIILDANVFIEAAKNKINLFDQVAESFPDADIVSSAFIMAELRRIARKKSNDSIAAKIALQIFADGVRIKKTKTAGDDSLLELCDSNSVLITQDRELRGRCAKAGFSTGYVRERKYLIIGGKSC
ncbi:MAG: PIN domain-containing protein [Candidatus Aenigmatarchaeota archaeon]